MRRITTPVVAAVASFALAGDTPEDAPARHPLASLHADAATLRPLVESDLARSMLDQAAFLPTPEPRTIYAAFRPNRAYTADDYAALPQPEREGLRELVIEPADYYSTFYGTPMVYARLLDLASDAWGDDATLKGKRLLDLGYGQLGQLRLWAQMGAEVTGVEVDPILTKLYDGCAALGDADGDPETPGSVRLIECAWPNNPACRGEVGAGYDLFVSRNLLKRGYVKPAKLNPDFPPPVAWGMTDAEALGHLYDLMNPGGLVIVYSLGPAPDPAKPWSDIGNPWPREAWEAAGFEVIAHDAGENAWARDAARALGWGERMDVDHDLFGVYSLCRRPPE